MHYLAVKKSRKLVKGENGLNQPMIKIIEPQLNIYIYNKTIFSACVCVCVCVCVYMCLCFLFKLYYVCKLLRTDSMLTYIIMKNYYGAFIWPWGLGFPWAIENWKHGHLRSDILTLSGKFKSQDFLFLFPYSLQNSESQLDKHIRF